tara:strand:- start:2 stop:220 length:219 start_codon:yes stop_codon:yes gene_type:complete
MSTSALEKKLQRITKRPRQGILDYLKIKPTFARIRLQTLLSKASVQKILSLDHCQAFHAFFLPKIENLLKLK